jgi:hypothetical protein
MVIMRASENVKRILLNIKTHFEQDNVQHRLTKWSVMVREAYKSVLWYDTLVRMNIYISKNVKRIVVNNQSVYEQ